MPRSFGVLHDLPPEPDLLVDGHFFDNLDVAQVERLSLGAAVHVEAEVHSALFLPPDVIERHVGKFRHFDDGRERVEVPQREHVVALAHHFIEVLVPEVHAPHLGNVVLRRVAVVGVAGCAPVRRDVELDAAGLDVGRMRALLHPDQRAQADRLSHIQATVHGAVGVAADYADLAIGPVNLVALGLQARRVDGELHLQRRRTVLGRCSRLLDFRGGKGNLRDFPIAAQRHFHGRDGRRRGRQTQAASRDEDGDCSDHPMGQTVAREHDG